MAYGYRPQPWRPTGSTQLRMLKLAVLAGRVSPTSAREKISCRVMSEHGMLRRDLGVNMANVYYPTPAASRAIEEGGGNA